MKLEIKPIVVYAALIGVIILIIALVKGCKEGNRNYDKYRKVDSINSVLLNVVAEGKKESEESKKAYQDSLEFERGQYSLLESKKHKAENDLDAAVNENSKLLKKYKLHEYKDTTSVLAPAEFIEDCHECFNRLINDSVAIGRYKVTIGNMQGNWDKQTKLYQNRINGLYSENKTLLDTVQKLVSKQESLINSTKPHGKLYLSWGVLWSPWPIAAGGGLLYKNKRDLILGAKCYYGKYGTSVETSINFPLSLKFK